MLESKQLIASIISFYILNLYDKLEDAEKNGNEEEYDRLYSQYYQILELINDYNLRGFLSEKVLARI